MAVYSGLTGKIYRTAAKPFAGGGEGDIFDIVGRSDEVAKIYKPAKRTAERERKLSTMVQIKPHVVEQYSWPCDVLYENGHFVGYIMPKIVGKEKLRNIYVYDKRKGKPWTLYLAIAKNLSSVVYNVHEIGQVIGDLNPENILVDPKTGLVTLVDTDSYHISEINGLVHRCGVGMPEFVAPEIQGKHFPSAPLPTFTKETDLFSLSVLIFSLLMNGAHPFTCKTISGSSSKFQPVDNITRGTCAYFNESSLYNIAIPRYAPALESLPYDLQVLFKRAFVTGHKNPKLRPTAEEYYNVLEILENNIKQCSVTSDHLYYKHAAECPWCKVSLKMKITRQSVFVPRAIRSGLNPQVNKPSNVSTPPPSGYAPVASNQSGTSGNKSVSGNNTGISGGNQVKYSGKNRAVAGILGLLFGPLGIHNFYLGKKRGVAQFLLSFVFIGILWGYLEGLFILSGMGCTDGKGGVLRGRRSGWKVFFIACGVHVVFCMLLYVLFSYTNILGVFGLN
ncbi:MAG: NINE protein [Nitrososphaerota archaeon]|jgi:DNA-binding helix-hairpin-helix protein with protein kinase domain/TM2 domain-containing membrane protein YozV|nr:NINE protein [Nitrososphaerota archaeon]